MVNLIWNKLSSISKALLLIQNGAGLFGVPLFLLALFSWKLILDKLPTDEKTIVRGFHLPSKCSLCLKEDKTLYHLFFSCSCACNVWNWLWQMLGYNSLIACLNDCFLVMNITASAKCGLVNIVTIVSSIQAI